MKFYNKMLKHSYNQLSKLNTAEDYLSLMKGIEALQNYLDDLEEIPNVICSKDVSQEAIGSIMSSLPGELQIGFSFFLMDEGNYDSVIV